MSYSVRSGIYTCDLFHDDQPTPIKLRSNKKFVSIPYSLEMNDTIAYVVNRVEPRQYGHMIKANFDRLYQEGAQSALSCVFLRTITKSLVHTAYVLLKRLLNILLVILMFGSQQARNSLLFYRKLL